MCCEVDQLKLIWALNGDSITGLLGDPGSIAVRVNNSLVKRINSINSSLINR